MKCAIIRTIMPLLNLILIVSILITSACNNKKSQEERDPNAYYASVEKVGDQNVVVCDVSKINRKIKIPLSKLVDSWDMVFLETTDASMLPELHRFAVSENYLCVAGEGKPVKLFKSDGSFISDIGKIGRGPGEYNSTPYQIILEEKSKSIFMTSAFSVNKILQYDLNGNFVGAISLLYDSPKARIWIEGDTITVMSMVFDDKMPIVYQQTRAGKLIQQLPVIKNLISKPDFSNEIVSTFNTNSFDFQIISEDTLFHYNAIRNTLEPQLVFLSFPNSINPILTEFPDCYFGTGYIKRDNNKYERWDVIVNKTTLKTSFYEVFNDSYSGISHRLFGCNKGMFIASTPAFKLMNEIERILKENKPDAPTRQKLEKTLSQLHENDNDVLFIGKLKRPV